MYKIDAHNHPDYHGRNYERHIADMNEKGIAQTWLLSWECPASKVTIIGANTLPKSWKLFGGETYLEMMEHILQRNKEDRRKYNYEFDYEFIDA